MNQPFQNALEVSIYYGRSTNLALVEASNSSGIVMVQPEVACRINPHASFAHVFLVH